METVVEEGQASVVAPGCSGDEDPFGDPFQLTGFETSWKIVERGVSF